MSAGHAELGAPTARPLVPLAAPKEQVERWRAQVCALPELACAKEPTSLTLYRTALDSADTAWGIVRPAFEPADMSASVAPPGPILVKLRRDPADAWKLERRWDFSNYAHSDSGLASDHHWPYTLYPALYPVGPGRWAVAVIATASQAFAGGGAGYDSADFVVLTDGDPTTTVYKNVPFSCSKDLRGCMSEEEYRQSPNCSDFYEAFLTISYRPSKVADRYIWTLVWHERHQPPNVPKSRTEVTQRAVELSVEKIDTTRATASFSFCGGGIGSSPDEETL
jgi:hypothetical protein